MIVLLAYVGKRLPINNLSNNSVHIAITVLSFAGFVLFSIYRLEIDVIIKYYFIKIVFQMNFRAMLGATLAVQLLRQPFSSLDDLLRLFWNLNF